MTYGWNKKSAIISLDDFARYTKMRKPNILRAINRLQAMNIVFVRKEFGVKTVIKIDNPNPVSYSLIKDYHRWKPLSKLITHKTVIKNDNESLSKLITPLPIIKNNIKTKSTKDSILLIFSCWNRGKIVVHKDVKKFTPSINAALKIYTEEEITQAITNYSEILHDKAYVWSHRWALDKFLSQKNAIDRFLEVNNPKETLQKTPPDPFNTLAY